MRHPQGGQRGAPPSLPAQVGRKQGFARRGKPKGKKRRRLWQPLGCIHGSRRWGVGQGKAGCWGGRPGALLGWGSLLGGQPQAAGRRSLLQGWELRAAGGSTGLGSVGWRFPGSRLTSLWDDKGRISRPAQHCKSRWVNWWRASFPTKGETLRWFFLKHRAVKCEKLVVPSSHTFLWAGTRGR